jgi:hypothetical protein
VVDRSSKVNSSDSDLVQSFPCHFSSSQNNASRDRMPTERHRHGTHQSHLCMQRHPATPRARRRTDTTARMHRTQSGQMATLCRSLGRPRSWVLAPVSAPLLGVACGYCSGQHREISVTAVSRFMNGSRGLNGSLSAAVTGVVRWWADFLHWRALADRDKAVFCACPLHDASQFGVHL